MKKLLIVQLILLVMATVFAHAKEGISGGESRNNSTPIEVNKKLTLLPEHDSVYNGKDEKYGYYTFHVPSNATISIAYTAPNDGGSWFQLYNASNREKVVHKWLGRGTSGIVDTVILDAGDYYFLINKKGTAVKGIPFKVNLTLNNPSNLEEGISGGESRSNPTQIEVNKEVVLLPEHHVEYNGKDERYGFYAFTVPTNSIVNIKLTAPTDGRLWFELHNASNRNKIVSKWLGKGTSGTVDTVTLQAGNYYFYIKKMGTVIKGIPFKVNLTLVNNNSSKLSFALHAKSDPSKDQVEANSLKALKYCIAKGIIFDGDISLSTDDVLVMSHNSAGNSANYTTLDDILHHIKTEAPNTFIFLEAKHFDWNPSDIRGRDMIPILDKIKDYDVFDNVMIWSRSIEGAKYIRKHLDEIGISNAHIGIWAENQVAMNNSQKENLIYKVASNRPKYVDLIGFYNRTGLIEGVRELSKDIKIQTIFNSLLNIEQIKDYQRRGLTHVSSHLAKEYLNTGLFKK